uniref:JmjC domain-containing protein n=1 Tax=Pyramimonas obovata TaxID=1411642 RepID=A0A7S0QY96_9CHLO|mmetsp:Transcript_18061/g.39472  ORF Transcript_18061/g.39472 Transcript_18061/m.39472 type:complete len:428 (+) Transcript_18061:2-1285(+)
MPIANSSRMRVESTVGVLGSQQLLQAVEKLLDGELAAPVRLQHHRCQPHDDSSNTPKLERTCSDCPCTNASSKQPGRAAWCPRPTTPAPQSIMPVATFASRVNAHVHPEEPELLYWQWRGLPAPRCPDLHPPSPVLAPSRRPDPPPQGWTPETPQPLNLVPDPVQSRSGSSELWAPARDPSRPSGCVARKRKLEPGAGAGDEEQRIGTAAASQQPTRDDAADPLEGLPPGLRTFLAEVVEPLAAPAFLARAAVRQRNVWWGRSVTSRLHFDAMDNLYTMVHGVKTFHLYPPGAVRPEPWHADRLNNQASAGSVLAPNLAASTLSPLAVQLAPGDSLFIPSGWWHEVFTVHGSALAVNSFLEPAPLTRLRPTILHLASDRFAKWVNSVAEEGADRVVQGLDSVAEEAHSVVAEGGHSAAEGRVASQRP